MTLPRSFWVLFAIQFIGAFCDNVYRNALLIFVTFVLLTDPAQAVPVVSMAAGLFILPFFLFSGFAGRWADRVDQAWAIQRLKMIEIPLMAIAVLAMFTGSIPFMLTSLFLLGMQAAFFGPLKYSVLPRLLSPDQLSLGNGYVEAGTFIAILLGTILGGVVVMLPQGVMWIGVILGCMTIVAYALSRLLPPMPPGYAVAVIGSPWQFIRQTPVLQASILGIAFLWFMGSSVLTLLPDFVRTSLQATPIFATILMALFSIGVAVGSLLAAILRHRVLPRHLVLGGLGTLCLLAMSIYPIVGFQNHLLIASVMAALAVSAGVFSVPLYTALQSHSPDQMRARIVAVNNIVNAGFMVVSALLIMGSHAVGLHSPQIILVCGVLGLPVLYSVYRKF